MHAAAASSVTDLAVLRERVRRIERGAALRHGVLRFGVDAIDCALPEGGLALGAVHEILGAGGDEEDGAAASGFAASTLARLGAGSILWCLKQNDLYGPGLAEHGLDPSRLVIVRATRDDEILWAIEEGLRDGVSAGLAAVVGEIGRLPMVASRRLQLAAERSGVIGLLLRRWRTGGEAAVERERPNATMTRWRISAMPSAEIPGMPGIGWPRWRVELLRCRGGMPAAWNVPVRMADSRMAELGVADATGPICLPAGLADRPVAPQRLHSGTLRRHAG